MREALRAGREQTASEPYEPPTFDTGRPRVDVTDVARALDVLDLLDERG